MGKIILFVNQKTLVNDHEMAKSLNYFFLNTIRSLVNSSVKLKVIEAVIRRCFVKKVILEISQNSQENTCARNSFLNSGTEFFL